MQRRLGALLLIFLTALSSRAYDITGKIIDTAGEGLPEATVRLLAAKDSAYVKGGASDIAGSFRLQGIKTGKYILECSYMGYTTKYVDVQVKTTTVKVPDVSLEETSYMLQDAVVTAVKTPIKVMGDTVEFNADSFKTRPNAVVEDLLKRLPGVEVDTDGKITHNGKEITKIMVDGKEFFANDPTVASQNLPVNMVDKLQVLQRKSDFSRLTGVDDGEEETVINLTVKKGMKNGWFGDITLGAGTQGTFNNRMMINRFKDGNQFTVLGNVNNADGHSSPGFSREGINTEQSIGTNFNVGNEEKFRVGGDVFYRHTKSNNITTRERIYNFADSFPSTNSHSRNLSYRDNVDANFRMEWKPDSFNTFDFRPEFSFSHSESNSDSYSANLAGNAARDSVSRSQNINSSRGNSYNISGRLIYNHNFKHHRGRSFSISANYRFSDSRTRQNSYSWNRFYLMDSLDIYDQYLDNHSWNNAINARATWTEPIGDSSKGNFIDFAYSVNYRWNNSDRNVYDHPVDLTDPAHPVIDMNQLIFNDTLSNQFRNNFMTQNIRMSYKKVSKNFRFELGVSAIPSMTKSSDLIRTERSQPERWVWNYAPFSRMRWKIKDQTSLNFDYNGRSESPSIDQLQPVPDYTDPLRVIVGNPNLDPSFDHNFRLRFSTFDAESQRAIALSVNASLTQNAIKSKTTFNPETSGQITTYANVNGVWNAGFFNTISMPFRRKTWSYNHFSMFRFSQDIGFNNGMRNRSREIGWSFRPSIKFRPDNLELSLAPTYSIQHNTNSISTRNGNSTIHRYGGTFNGNYDFNFGLTLNTDLSYTATSGYSDGFDTRSWMWNAMISYQFLRDKSATVSAAAYDILAQQTSIRRSITANYTDDSRSNILGRYVMFSISYRFNTFGKGKEPRPEGDWGPGRGFGPGGPRGMRGMRGGRR